jgi:hypothetical protein
MKPSLSAQDVKLTRSRAAAKGLKHILLVAMFLYLPGAASIAGSPSDVPSVSAGIGTCSADFLVTDSANKPVFDAKVHVKIKFGFMSKRDTDLEVGTNNDGKARIEGLPNKLKKPPLEFSIQKDGLFKTVTSDPATDCHPHFNITLTK